MVYTLTLNPSLDYMMPVRQLRTGATNRSEGEQIRIGGKGINVSILLWRLGVENLALGIAADLPEKNCCEGWTRKESVMPF